MFPDVKFGPESRCGYFKDKDQDQTRTVQKRDTRLLRVLCGGDRVSTTESQAWDEAAISEVAGLSERVQNRRKKQ